MSIEVTIICDSCAGLITAADTAREARRENREQGGRSRPPLDWCASCVTSGRVQAVASEGKP